jgi:hypothetical protein
MKRYRWLLTVVALIVIGAIGAAGGFVLGDIQSARAMTVQRATPHELAEAMKGDHFYSDYRQSALLVTGAVASVSRDGGLVVVAFETGSSYGASCELGAVAVAPQVGQTFTVLAAGPDAERLPAGVMLHDCIVP